MNKTIKSVLGASVWAMTCIAAANPALARAEPEAQADTAQSDIRDEIIVTAQKKAENVQDVPIAITALNAAALEAAKIEDTKDLQFNAPGLQ